MVKIGLIIAICGCFFGVDSLPDQGIWDAKLDQQNQFFTVSKSLLNASKIVVKIECHALQETKIRVGWLLRMTPCADEYIGASDATRTKAYYIDPRTDQLQYGYQKVELQRSNGDDMMDIDEASEHEKEYTCSGDQPLILTDESYYQHHVLVVSWKDEPASAGGQGPKSSPNQQSSSSSEKTKTTNPPAAKKDSQRKKRSVEKTVKKVGNKATVKPREVATHAVATTWQDGTYLFILRIDPLGVADFSADVSVSMKGPKGYLSWSEWPLLPLNCHSREYMEEIITTVASGPVYLHTLCIFIVVCRFFFCAICTNHQFCL